MDVEVIRPLVREWERCGIELLPGVEEDRLTEAIRGLGHETSRDVLDLYRATRKPTSGFVFRG